MAYNIDTRKVGIIDSGGNVQPFPTTGTGATNMSGLSDVDVTTTAPTAGNVLTYQSGKWKPAPPTGGGSSSSNVYVVPLATYGITTGFPAKPYVSGNYTTANNNITGINNAIAYAAANGYTEIVFPQGDYAVCYPNPILTKANLIINFNFARLKVIYSSSVRSPLDTSSNPIYKFSGDTILCQTSNTKIINAILIGDRIDRDWTVSLADQKTVETTHGITIASGAVNSGVYNCNISYYMGDAIYMAYTPYESFDITPMEFGSLDASGTPVTGTTVNSLRSTAYITIPASTPTIAMIGLGFAPITSIPNKQYDVSFYTSGNVFISKQLNVRTRDRIPVPVTAAKLKLAWEGDGTVDNSVPEGVPPYWALMLRIGLSDTLTIAYNEIHRCHRGGIFLGVNNVLIERNYLHDLGEAGEFDVDGLPTFNDFTRYGITSEDNVGNNCRIINNVFDNIRMAIAMRGEYNEISSNEFRRCGYGTILYNLSHVNINNNMFYYSSLQSYEEHFNYTRDWVITNNFFVNSEVWFQGSGTLANFSNNAFTTSNFRTSDQVLIFTGNTFDGSTYTCNSDLDTTIIDGCSFIRGSEIRFNNPIAADRITNCVFDHSQIRAQSTDKVVVRNSYFTESRYEYSTGITTFVLSGCKVFNTAIPIIASIKMMDIGSVAHSLEIRDCTINTSFVNLINAMDWKDLTILNSTINYTLTATNTHALQDGWGDILGAVVIKNSKIMSNYAISHNIGSTTKTFSESTNVFTNFSLVEGTTKVHSDKMSAPPTTGTWTLGTLIYNTTPTSSGNLGWICTTAGTPGTWTAISLATGGGGGSSAWGSITGTLASQTDLVAALNLKADKASPTFTGTVSMPSNTNYSTPQGRNISMGTANPTGGSNGDIYFKYV